MMLRKLFTATLALGYGLYLTANLSREEKQALKTELQTKRQPVPVNEIIETPTAPAIENTPESQIEITDPWTAPLQAPARPRWTTQGTIHPVTFQLALPAARNYKGLTLKELKEVAKSKNIKGYYKMRSAELVKALSI